MTIPQYERWIAEILAQRDLVVKMQQHERLMAVFVQDVWLDAREALPEVALEQITLKSKLMFELQGELVK